MVDLSVLSRVSTEEGYLARNVLIVSSSMIRWFCVRWKGRRERCVLVVRLGYIIIIIIIITKKDSMRYTNYKKMFATTCGVHKPP